MVDREGGMMNKDYKEIEAAREAIATPICRFCAETQGFKRNPSNCNGHFNSEGDCLSLIEVTQEILALDCIGVIAKEQGSEPGSCWACGDTLGVYCEACMVEKEG